MSALTPRWPIMAWCARPRILPSIPPPPNARAPSARRARKRRSRESAMDRNGRLERVLRRMAADGADTLVALSNARHSMARPDVATHLSGFRSLGESALVLFGDGTARLIVTPARFVDRRHR